MIVRSVRRMEAVRFWINMSALDGKLLGGVDPKMPLQPTSASCEHSSFATGGVQQQVFARARETARGTGSGSARFGRKEKLEPLSPTRRLAIRP
jgi:hypothetical protein